MNISSNISSMQANQVFMNNSAQNVANSNTDGFIPNKTTITEGANGSVTAQTAKASNNGSTASQTDLSREMTDQISIENVQKANVSAIKTQDEMIGSLLDIRA